ncbi:unnamed protein product, partial [Pylaiella littoralis]
TAIVTGSKRTGRDSEAERSRVQTVISSVSGTNKLTAVSVFRWMPPVGCAARATALCHTTTLILACFPPSPRKTLLLQQAQEKHRADVVEMVEKDPVLKEQIREVLG